jgi:signal transduction histidine kinase
VKFGERVTALSAEIEARLGVLADVDVIAGIDDMVDPQCAQHCVQALREILSNVVRHSHASAVTIRVDTIGDLIEIVVTDNGVGFTPNVGTGRGVRNLTSRAHELGGNCTIKSKIDGPTTVRWTALRKV